jgi:hypothetical protein
MFYPLLISVELHATLKTPKYILELLIDEKITELNEKELLKEVRSLCGEYAGRIFPYIYKIYRLANFLVFDILQKNRLFFKNLVHNFLRCTNIFTAT